MNIGHSSRLGYDKCAYGDRLEESQLPLQYKINPIQTSNTGACFAPLGPRGGKYGVSTTIGFSTAPSQDLVDVESILSNRNNLQSKCRHGQVNDVDVSQFKLQHARVCKNNDLDSMASRLTNPSGNYRGMSINRFYDLDRNPQENIFWNFSVNTKLEAKDNYVQKVPVLMEDKAQPQ